jgi:hypothetical protein
MAASALSVTDLHTSKFCSKQCLEQYLSERKQQYLNSKSGPTFLEASNMSDVQLLIVLGVAALLVLAVFFSLLLRRRHTSIDHWLSDGTKLKCRADKP